jgi:hypothetical protein
MTLTDLAFSQQCNGTTNGVHFVANAYGSRIQVLQQVVTNGSFALHQAFQFANFQGAGKQRQYPARENNLLFRPETEAVAKNLFIRGKKGLARKLSVKKRLGAGDCKSGTPRRCIHHLPIGRL